MLRRPPNSYIVSGSGIAETALSSHIEFSQVALLHKSIPDGINPNQTDSCHVGHRNGLRTADLAEAVQQGDSDMQLHHLALERDNLRFSMDASLQWELANSVRGGVPEAVVQIVEPEPEPDASGRVPRWHELVREQDGERCDSVR